MTDGSIMHYGGVYITQSAKNEKNFKMYKGNERDALACILLKCNNLNWNTLIMNIHTTHSYTLLLMYIKCTHILKFRLSLQIGWTQSTKLGEID